MQEGSYVICIDGKNWSRVANLKFNKLPVEGQIYQVRRIIPHVTIENGPDGIALEGIFGVWDFFTAHDGRKVYEECHFRKNRFAEIYFAIREGVIDESEGTALEEETVRSLELSLQPVTEEVEE